MNKKNKRTVSALLAVVVGSVVGGAAGGIIYHNMNDKMLAGTTPPAVEWQTEEISNTYNDPAFIKEGNNYFTLRTFMYYDTKGFTLKDGDGNLQYKSLMEGLLDGADYDTLLGDDTLALNKLGLSTFVADGTGLPQLRVGYSLDIPWISRYTIEDGVYSYEPLEPYYYRLNIDEYGNQETNFFDNIITEKKVTPDIFTASDPDYLITYCIDFGKLQPAHTGDNAEGSSLILTECGSFGMFPSSDPDKSAVPDSARNLAIFSNGFPSRKDLGEQFGLTSQEMEWCTDISLKMSRLINFTTYEADVPVEIILKYLENNIGYNATISLNSYTHMIAGFQYADLLTAIENTEYAAIKNYYPSFTLCGDEFLPAMASSKDKYNILFEKFNDGTQDLYFSYDKYDELMGTPIPFAGFNKDKINSYVQYIYFLINTASEMGLDMETNYASTPEDINPTSADWADFETLYHRRLEKKSATVEGKTDEIDFQGPFKINIAQGKMFSSEGITDADTLSVDVNDLPASFPADGEYLTNVALRDTLTLTLSDNTIYELVDKDGTKLTYDDVNETYTMTTDTEFYVKKKSSKNIQTTCIIEVESQNVRNVSNKFYCVGVGHETAADVNMGVDTLPEYQHNGTNYPYSDTSSPYQRMFPVVATPVQGRFEVPFQPILKDFSIKKLDKSDNAPLQGAVFTVNVATEDEGGTNIVYNGTEYAPGDQIAEVTTGADGSVLLENLPIGKYLITETDAPEGYMIDETTKLVEITETSEDVQTFEFKDSPVGKLKIEKKDSISGVSIQNVEFTLYNADKTTIYAAHDKFIYTATGVYELAGIPFGTYYLKESKPANGYVTPADEFIEIVLAKDSTTGKITDVIKTITNTPKADLSITKTDSNSQPLQGAEFNIYYLDDDNQKVYITDASGNPKVFVSDENGAVSVTDIEGLPLSGYNVYAEETKAPTGYIGMDAPIQLTAGTATSPTSVTNYSATITNKQYAILIIEKLEKNSSPKKPIEGVQFKLYSKDGTGNKVYVKQENSTEDLILTTDVNGLAETPKINPGTYWLQEITTPVGYYPLTEDKEIVVPAVSVVDGAIQKYKATVENIPFGILRIKKVDNTDSTKTLAGAKFKIRTSATNKTYLKDSSNNDIVLTTDINGLATTPQIAPGNYWLEEIEAPVGYFKLKELVPVSVPKVTANDASGNPIPHEATISNKPYGELVIIKKDGTTNAPLSGAKFSIYTKDASNNPVYLKDAAGAKLILTTDNTGKVKISELEPGTYFVREEQAPLGYKIDTAEHEIEVRPVSVDTASGTMTIAEQVFTNIPYSKFRIVKKDAITKTPLSGAKFSIYSKNAADEKVYLTNTDGSKLILTTDEDGCAETPDIAPGTYWIHEIEAPQGYNLNPDDMEIEAAPLAERVDATSQTIVLQEAIFTNYPYTLLTIVKKDANDPDKFLDGAKFKLYTKDADNNYIAVKNEDNSELVLTTSDGGKATTPRLKPGTYYLLEIEAPAGYIKNEDYQEVVVRQVETTGEGDSLTEVAQVAVVTNNPYSLLKIKKVDATDTTKNLSGAVFKVYTSTDGTNYTLATDIDGNNITLTTGADGTATSTKMHPGNYYVKEETAPVGYFKKEGYIPITLNPVTVQGVTQTIVAQEAVVENSPYGQLEITKVDNANTTKKLEGAQFKVYKNGTALKDEHGNDLVLTTDASGKATTPKVEPGTYSFVEIKAPNGYFLNSTPVEITINAVEVQTTASSKTVIPQKSEIGNDAYGIIKIVKQDSKNADKKLEGAQFNIYQVTGGTNVYLKDAAGETLVLTTDENGVAKTGQLQPGEYYVREIKAPDGYLLNSTPVKVNLLPVQVEESGGTVTIVEQTVPVTNDAYARLRIIKKDALTPANLLSGAKFNIFTGSKDDRTYIMEDGHKKEFVTVDGEITVDKLLPGKYFIEEIEAPAGYLLNDNPITEITLNPVTVNKEAATITIIGQESEITNMPYGILKIKKVDGSVAEETPLQGAEFYIYTKDDSGNPVYIKNNDGSKLVLTTDENGYAQTPKLLPGQYFIKEKTAPVGYFLDENEHAITLAPVVVSADEHNDVTIVAQDYKFENSPYAVLEITKVDEKDTSKVLTGAKFYIYQLNGANKEYLLDDSGNRFVLDCADGHASTGKINPGTYYLEEFEAPLGYFLDTTPIKMDVPRVTVNKKAETSTLVTQTSYVTNSPYGILKIKKVDSSDTSKNLSGAEFNIFTYNDTNDKVYLLDKNGEKYTLVTDDNGLAETDALKPGIYYIEETVAPLGYKLNTIPQQIQLNPVNVKDVAGVKTIVSQESVIGNAPYAILNIEKIDGITNLPLEGAKFNIFQYDDKKEKVYLMDGSNRLTLITDEEGHATTDSIDPGTYYLEEIEAPEGYTVINPITEVVVGPVAVSNTAIIPQKLVVENFNNDVKLYKKDITNSAPVPGAEVYVYNSDDEIIYKGISDENGEITVKSLPAGKYTFKEITPPSGYTTNTTVFSFEVKADGTVVGDNTITDSPTHVKITKKNLTTEETVPGAEIEIYDSNNKVVFKGITDKNGEVEAFYLPAGKYTFREVVAPNGYILNEAIFDFEILENGQVIGDCTVKDKPTHVVITKKDLTTEETVPGAEIEIYDSNGKSVFRGTTNEKGEVEAFYLPIGKYTFREVVAPDGYIINEAVFDFEILPNGEIKGDCTVKDKPTRVVITKKDLTTEETVPGAEIEIYDSEGDVVFSDITDEDGEIEAFYLPAGKYTFREVVAPDGYVLNEAVFKFEILENGKVKGNCTIEDKPTHVLITKKDLTTEETVPGAEIEIYDSKGDVVFKGTTNKNGEVEAFYLPAGTYTFREIVAPEGYTINETVFSFQILKNGDIVGDNTISDKPSHVLITKKDLTTEETVPGAEIEIYDSKGEVVFKGTTDKNGIVEAFYLPTGKYTFREVVAPNGYIINEAIFDFEILENGKIIGDCTVKDKPTHVVITKKDLTTEETVPGAEIEIYDSNGKTVFNGITDKNGEVETFYLPVGKYTFREIVAPNGYILNEAIFEFEILENGEIIGDCTVKDKPTHVVITKKDIDTSESLPGALIEIYDVLGNVVVSEVTDENGEIEAFYLPVGTYTFVELYAPEGYLLNKAEKTFTITETGEIIGDTVIYDQRIPEEVVTGINTNKTDKNSLIIILATVLLAIIGFSAIAIKKTKSKR